MTETCCELHITGPAGTCCDEDDCGPCCADCPTCPTLHNAVKAGPAYGRSRNERGSTSIIGAFAIVIGIAAVVDVAFGIHIFRYMAHIEDWLIVTVREIAHSVFPSGASTRR